MAHMRKVCFTLLALLHLAVGELHFAFSAELIEGETLAPRYRNGDKWTYRAVSKTFQGSTSQNMLNGEYEIAFENGKRLTFQIDDGRRVEEKNPGALNLMLPTPALIKSIGQYFQFPLAVGKKWQTYYHSDAYRQWLSPEITVTGIENVTTPAGVFSAYRIERRFNYSRSFTAAGESFLINVTETYFYSPQVRSIVNYHYQLDYRSYGDTTLFRTVDIELVKTEQRDVKSTENGRQD